MYRKSKRTIAKERNREKMKRWRDAKERKRIERAKECGEWTRHQHLLTFSISPDGRCVGLLMPDGWSKCGSERTIRAKLAKSIWRKAEQMKGEQVRAAA